MTRLDPTSIPKPCFYWKECNCAFDLGGKFRSLSRNDIDDQMLFLDNHNSVTFRYSYTRKLSSLWEYPSRNILPSHTRILCTGSRTPRSSVGIGKPDAATSPGAYTVYLSAFFFPKTIFTLPAMWFNGPKPLFPCIFIGEKSQEKALPCNVWSKIKMKRFSLQAIEAIFINFWMLGTLKIIDIYMLLICYYYFICKIYRYWKIFKKKNYWYFWMKETHKIKLMKHPKACRKTVSWNSNVN